jgi:hypothetical protein
MEIMSDAEKCATRPFCTLCLERNGTVEVRARDTSVKCGPPGANVLTYRVLVTAGDHCVDGAGFLIDHNDIAAYFERTYSVVHVFPSCELIAAQAIRDLHQIMSDRGCDVCSLEVSIAAFGQAGVTARWPFIDPRPQGA